MQPDDFIAYVHKRLGMIPRVEPYGTKIAERLTVGVDQLASPDTGEVLVIPQLGSLFDKTREVLGHPIPVTAGYRTHAHELHLQALGLKTAKFVSPHSFCALDLDARPRMGKTESQVCADIVAAVFEAAHQLRLPRPRVGVRAYSFHFVHVDLMFLLFKPFTMLEHPMYWPNLDAQTRALVSGWQPGVSW